MNLSRFDILAGVFLIGAAAWLGCSAPKVPAEKGSAKTTYSGSGPIRVVCTTGPVSDMLRNLGGDRLHVTGLMGPGVDPHLHTALPDDLERLAAADVIFYNGLHLEGRMVELFEQLSHRKPTHAVTQSLVDSKSAKLRKPPEFEGYYDPHVWHDPQLWSECVKHAAKILAEFDPQHRDEYESNRDAYLSTLEEAHAYASQQLQAIPERQRVLVSAHDAFNYFCHAYDMTSMPLKGVSTEDEVTISRMDEVVAYLVEHKIKAVFVESAASPQIVKALIEPCRRAGHEVRIGGELYADALGPPEKGADTYVGMFRANVDTIVSALK